MKKNSFVLSLFVLVILTSCVKSQICECVTYIDEEEQPKIDNTYPIDGLSVQAAIDECNQMDSTEISLTGVNVETNCELN